MCLGAVLLAAAFGVVAETARSWDPSVFLPLAASWALSVWLTDKYTHKYSQRYYPYLLAAHGKAAAIMALTLLAVQLATPRGFISSQTWWVALLFALADLLFSCPCRRMGETEAVVLPAQNAQPPVPPSPPKGVDTGEVKRFLAGDPVTAGACAPAALIDEQVVCDATGDGRTALIDTDVANLGDGEVPLAFLVQKKSMNSVGRLNIFLRGLPSCLSLGGYFLFRYRPMESQLLALKSRKKGAGLWTSYAWHFLWRRALPKTPILEKLYFSKCLAGLDRWVYSRTQENRRVISRAEMWGRMYYWGFEVLAERQAGEDFWVLTRRTSPPQIERKASFFLITKLTKVGLDGRPLQLHKLRTMYPFSEFIQEKVYRDHGLSNTGKFQNDFRLTDYGRFVRRFWLDEIPQIFDWLRGEIKLVGMRATSPHFLSLYPPELYALYVQTKPGLVPPIFDASTAGFEDIVRVELDYLRAYEKRPVATDIRYFFITLHDIFIRGVRSK